MARALLLTCVHSLSACIPPTWFTTWAISASCVVTWSNAGGIQVLCDLTISLSLGVYLDLSRDARAQGRNPWPFLVATLFLGSIGPLLYLVLRPRTQQAGVSGAVAANLIH